MARTLLQIINAVQNELGLPTNATTTVIGNTDATTVQLLAFAQAEVEELRRVHNWTLLHNEYNLVAEVPVTTTGNTTENSAIITGIPDTSTFTAQYYTVIGAGIPVAARILSVDSATQVTLTMEATATATAADLVFAKDTYPEPTDFDHFVNRTWWDRTNRWELLGPDSAQMDQWHRSGIVVTGPRRHFRQVGYLSSNYRLWPPPSEITEPVQIAFEYISNYCIYVQGSKLAYSTTFAYDTDIPILDDRAIIMGIKWRFWEQKGLNYTTKRADYDTYVQRLIAQDGGRQTLSLVKRTNPIFISPANVQDGFFPGATGPNMS